MENRIVAKGIKWNSNRLKHVPDGKPGVFVIFDEESKSVKVMEHVDIKYGLRAEWWKKNFWYFSWFVTSPPEYRKELADKCCAMNFDELWGMSSELDIK